MSIVQNTTLQRLIDGRMALGVGLRQARTVDIAKAMKTAGFHWLMIDLEHSSMSLDTACQIAVAAQDVGITPLVRVPGHEHHYAARALDGGAQGIVVPHVDDAETARRIVSHCRYPPLGTRSATALLPQINFAPVPVGDAMLAAERTMMLVIMLETKQAINNVDEIAAVPGVDVLLIGTNDLCIDMGHPGAFDHPDVVAAYEAVAAACKRHGKYVGMGGIYQPDLMRRYIDAGARLILSGTDLTFLMSGARAQATAIDRYAPQV
jgi:2-keto-3-deoxy-L-rhamnonate aldolase RhmA